MGKTRLNAEGKNTASICQTCIMCDKGEYTGDSPGSGVGSALDSLGFDFRLTALNQNNAEMLLTLPVGMSIENMVKNLKIVLRHFGYSEEDIYKYIWLDG